MICVSEGYFSKNLSQMFYLDWIVHDGKWNSWREKCQKYFKICNFLWVFVYFGKIVYLNQKGLRSQSYRPESMLLCISSVCIDSISGVGRSYAQTNVDVVNCFFQRSSVFTGDGGVIYIYGGAHTLSVTDSLFYMCRCSSNGGAILVNSTGDSFINKVCAFQCSAGYGHFAYLRTTNDNIIEMVSVSKCSPSENGYFSFIQSTGNPVLRNSNSSLNSAYQMSGISTGSQILYTCSFCTVSNNKVSSGGICVYLSKGTGTITYTNIVHNNSPAYGIVYISLSGSYSMNFCVFNMNQNTLFCVYTGTLKVFHSFINHIGLISVSTPVSTFNNSITIKSTYLYYHYSSVFCNADNTVNIPPSFKQSFLQYSYRIYLFFIIAF